MENTLMENNENVGSVDNGISVNAQEAQEQGQERTEQKTVNPPSAFAEGQDGLFPLGSRIVQEYLKPEQDVQEVQKPQDDLISRLFREKEQGDRQAERAMTFLTRIGSRNYKEDEEMLREECYSLERDLYGFTAGDRGAQWNRGVPFETAAQHAKTLEGVITKGYSAIAPEGFNEWFIAKSTGASRDELAKLAGVDVNETKLKMGATGLGFAADLVRRSDADIDADLAKYDAKMYANNFMNIYKAMRPDMSEEAVALVDKAIQSGNGLDKADIGRFRALGDDDRMKAMRLIDMSRANVPAWFRDTMGATGDLIRSMVEGTVMFGQDIMMPNTVMNKLVAEGRARIQAGLEPLTDEEREMLKKEWDGSAGLASARITLFGPVGGGIAHGPASTYSAVDLIAMRHAKQRFNDALLVARKERDEMRRDELQVRMLTERKPYDNYNFVQEAITGAITTLPYMAEAAIPYAGIALVAMQQFENVKDQLIMDGFNPSTMSDGATAVQFGLACVWAATERLQAGGIFGKPLTALQYRTLMQTAAKSAVGRVMEVGGKLTKETLAETIYESVQEGLQGGIEKGTIAAFEGKGVEETIRAACNGVADDFVQSLGTMGVISIVGTGRKFRRAQTANFDAESIQDFASRQMQVTRAMRDTQPTVTDPAVTPKLAARREERANELVQKAAEIWRKSEDRADARNQIEDLFGLDEGSTRMLCEWLADRDTVIENLGRGQFAAEELKAAYGTDNVMEALYRHGTEGHWVVIENFFKEHYLSRGMSEEEATKQAKYQVGLEQNMAKKGINYRSPDGVFSNTELLDPVAFMRTFINPDLNVEDAEAVVDGKKMKGSAIVIPVKKQDGTTENFRLFSIVRPEGKIDINADSYATDVENLHQVLWDKDGKPVIKNGEATVITKDVWKKLSTKQKNEQIARHGWKVQGGFRFVSPNGKDSVSVNGIMSLFNKEGKYTAKTQNRDVAHEVAHAVVRFAREAGAIGKSEADVMRQLFGDAINEGELWNEEAMADSFRDYLQGQFDFGKFKPEYRGIVEQAFEAVRQFIINMLRTVGVDVGVNEQERRSAYDAVWEGIKSGDFSKLRQYANLRFAEEGGELQKEQVAEADKEEADDNRLSMRMSPSFRNDCAKVDGEKPTFAMYVRATKVGYAKKLADGTKVMETRTPAAVEQLIAKGLKVGDRVAFIETESGEVAGYATLSEITEPMDATKFHSEEVQKMHGVPVGDKYDIQEGKTKVGLVFTYAKESNGGVKNRMTGDRQGYRYSLVTKEQDAAYADAVANGDIVSALTMLKDAAKNAGYDDDTAYRASHHAPMNDGYNASLDNVKDMFGTDERAELLAMGYGRPTVRQAVDSIMKAKGNPDAMIDVWRAVPKNVKDVNIRRGDWVALSEEYAKNHGESWLDGKYKIIHGTVRAGDLFTDGNMIEEAGFDDGKERVYRDTKNGTKLSGITYDDNGNLIPLSQRFNSRNADIRYSLNAKPTENIDFEGAKKFYGVTDNIEDAYFILPDGSLLDLSQGGHDAEYNDPEYGAEHVDVGVFLGLGYQDKPVEKFLNGGAIRIRLDSNPIIDLRVVPTPEQVDKIYDYIEKAKELAEDNHSLINLECGEYEWEEITPEQAVSILSRIRNKEVRYSLSGRPSLKSLRHQELYERYRNGDESALEEAKQLVLEAANRAFPDSIIRDKNGNLVEMFHGSSNTWNKFEGHEGANGWGVYFTSAFPEAVDYAREKLDDPDMSEDEAEEYITSAFVNVTDEDAVTHSHYGYADTEWGGKLAGVKVNLQVVVHPSQIKSADPFTFDDAGNLIPLDERFNKQNDDIRYSLVTDKNTLDKLNSAEYITVYRAAIRYDDESVLSPKATRIRGVLNRQMIGKWYKSDENPDLMKADGKFKLDAANLGSDINAAYAPYWHTRVVMNNSQFSAAWKRPDITVFECHIPKFEFEGETYQAKGSEKRVGLWDWSRTKLADEKTPNDAKVYLSQYMKVVREVPVDEIAANIKSEIGDGEIAWNTVSYPLRKALRAIGANVTDRIKGLSGKALEEAKSAQADERYSLIIGEKGARNLRNNVTVLENLEVAKKMIGYKMHKSLTNPNHALELWNTLSHDEKLRVKLATGWEVGADGMWKNEQKEFKFKVPLEVSSEEQKAAQSKRKECQDEYEKLSKLEKEKMQWFIKGLSLHATKEEVAKRNKEIDDLRKKQSEVSAREMQYIPASLGMRSLSEFLSGSEVIDAYPELKAWTISYGRLSNGTYGETSDFNREITISYATPQEELNDTILHEVQHAIQGIEGFGKGGNTSDFRQTAIKDPVLRKKFNAVHKKAKNASFLLNDKWSLYYALKKIGDKKQINKDSSDAYNRDAIMPVLAEEIKDTEYKSEEELAKVLADAYDLESPYGKYNRLAGEVESRNAGRRTSADITKLLEDTEDVSRDVQIVRKEVAYAMSAINAEENRQYLEEHKQAKQNVSLAADLVKNDAGDFGPNGDVRLTLTQYNRIGKQKLTDWLNNTDNNVTPQERDRILTGLDGMAKLMQSMRGKYARFSNWQDADVEYDPKTGKPYFKVVVQNAEYTMNFDFSTVCVRRRPLDGLLNALAQEKGGILEQTPLLTRAMIADIQEKVIKQHGFDVACPLCFVDTKRYTVDYFARRFAETFNRLLGEFNAGAKSEQGKRWAFRVKEVHAKEKRNEERAALTAKRDAELKAFVDKQTKAKNVSKKAFTASEEFKAKKAELTKKYAHDRNEAFSNEEQMIQLILAKPEERNEVKSQELISSWGQDTVVKNRIGLFGIWRQTGAGRPKDSVADHSWNNDIIDPVRDLVTDETVDFDPSLAFAIGGVRIQSFSDYVPTMVFDYMQMIAELAAKGLPMHTYTKEENFVKIFGHTGIKMNMSLVPAVSVNPDTHERLLGKDGKPIPAGLDADGNYLWADECFPTTGENSAFILRKMFGGNVGTIAVGVSNEHIIKLLRDANIDQVIPYHASGINSQIAWLRNIAGYEDYTEAQHERYSPWKLDKDGNEMLDANGQRIPSKWVTKLESAAKAKAKAQESLAKANAELAQAKTEAQKKKAQEAVDKAKESLANAEEKSKGIDKADRVTEWYGELSAATKRGEKDVPRAAAKAFREKCYANDIIPRFNEFRREENYYKLLADFRMYKTETKGKKTVETYSPQTAVAFNFGGDENNTCGKDVLKAIHESLKTYENEQDKYDKTLPQMLKEAKEVIRSRMAEAEQEWVEENAKVNEKLDIATAKRQANSANNERLTIIQRNDGVNAADYARAFVASTLMQGREVTEQDVGKLLKGLRLPDDNAALVLQEAQTMAKEKAMNVGATIQANDPTLLNDLAKTAMKDRFNRAMVSALMGGAKAADPVIGENLEKMRQRQLNRALDEAHGFTQAEMRSELYVNLSAALFKVADFEKTPEQLAKLAAWKKEQEEKKARGEQTDEEDILKLFDEEGNLKEIAEPSHERKEVPESVRKLLDEIMAGADKREERRKRREAKKAEAKKAREEAAKAAGENTEAKAEDDTGADDVNFGEETIDEETFDLLKPVFSSADQFASFVEEWVFRKLKDKNPKLQGASVFRDPVNLRELQNTAKDILHNLAKDTLGKTPAYVVAERQIDAVMNYKYLTHVHNHVAYVYGRIHENALRINRNKLVTELVTEMKKKTGARGRFKNTEEEKNRKVFAKTELWVRKLIPLLTMSEEKLNTKRQELEDALARYNTATAEGKWEADNDLKYQEASLEYSLLQQYGGMKRWMVGDIIDASNEILRALDGNIQEFLMRQEERREANRAVRQALIDAMEDGYKYVGKSKLNSTLNKLLRFPDAEMGNIELRLKDLLKYCRDEQKKAAALKAIEELMFQLGRGSEKFNMTIGKGRKEINEMLARCYGSAQAGIKHLTEELPQSVKVGSKTFNPETEIFQQGGHEYHTFGNLLQLYGSCLQVDYHDNVITHGRDKQLYKMFATLTPQDRMFHKELVMWYKQNRLELSNAVEAITGLPVRSPDEKYIPVKPLNEPNGFKANVQAWNPITASMTARIRHGLDFDENADILLMVDKAIQDRAQIIGYGQTGIFLRDTIAHHDVQVAGRQFADKGQMGKIIDQITDTLTQARPDSGKASPTQAFLRQYLSLAYLSWNVVSGSKQLGSFSVWGNTVGLRKVGKYMVNVDMDAVRELMQTDGYKARYMMGWTPETQELLRDPNPNRLKALWEKGMCTSRFFDQLCCLWMAQGCYRDLKQKFMTELNEDGTRLYTDEEAKERAATITWNWCEEGQQTGRKEFLNEKQRKNSLASFFYQFMTAPLLQLNYELAAIRKVAMTGGKDGKKELARAVIINHVLVPAVFELLSVAFQALGLSWRPDDDEEWMESVKRDFFYNMALGSYAPMWVLVGITEGIWAAATEGNMKEVQALPSSSAVKHVFDVSRLVIRSAKYGMTELGVADFADITADDCLKDLNRFFRNSFAPYKQADNLKRRWTGERFIGE